MTRKKVKLAFISNDSSRKTTFKKRKKGLIKKVNELSTLCGITECAIIYSPYDSKPDVWPSNSGVQQVVSEFQRLPEMDQHKKMVDQESFLRQRIAKASENLKRQRKENREFEMTEVMFQCLVGNMGMFNLNIMDLNDLGYLIDQNLREVNRRIEILKNSGMEIGGSSNAATYEGVGTLGVVAATTTPAATIEVGSSSSFAAAATFYNPIQQHQHVGFYEQPQNLNHNQNHQQWFMEMINHPEQIGFPFMNGNHQNRNHHNHNHHHQPPQQQIPGNSSTTTVAASSSSIIPVSSSNLTNNIWFF